MSNITADILCSFMFYISVWGWWW